MKYIHDLLLDYNQTIGVISWYLSYAILIAIIIILCIVANLITKKVILKLFTKIIKKNKYQWDNILLDHMVFNRLANIIPGIIVYLFAPAFNTEVNKNQVKILLHRGASVYILIVIIFVVNALLDAINDIYRNYPISKVRPIKGLLQVVKIIFYIIIGIVMVEP
jgi:miniconductance mechanosensitive channel